MHLPDPDIPPADAGIAGTEADGLLLERDYFLYRAFAGVTLILAGLKCHVFKMQLQNCARSAKLSSHSAKHP
jgi:hypothetical protein